MPNLPSAENLVALIAMCILPGAFIPEQIGDKADKVPWRLPDGVHSDRVYGKAHAL